MKPDTLLKHPACEGVIRDLLDARRTGKPRSASRWRDVLTSEAQAYAVQEAIAADLGWYKSGAPDFWKSGGPSRSQPMAHALLAPTGVVPTRASLRDFRWHKPAIEAEIALRLGVAVTPDQARALRFEDCAALVDTMAVTIEIADSRWQEGFDAPAHLRIADSGCHGALVVGEWVPYAPRDWSVQTCEVMIDGAQALVFKGSHTLSDPSWLLPEWLRHLTRFGHDVPAGTAVTTGSWAGALPVQHVGDIRVSFPGIGCATHVAF